jgi:hypothetical protein
MIDSTARARRQTLLWRAMVAPAVGTLPTGAPTVDVLPSGVLAAILGQLSCTQAQLGAARACRAWRSHCLKLQSERAFALRAFVTLASENRVIVLDARGETVQNFEPMPPSRSRRGARRTAAPARGHWRNDKHLYRWPTCLAFGPVPGSLFISQYRVRGVLRFDTDPTGTTYLYTRVAVSDRALESPEGIVANADGSLFVVSAAHGTVNHVSAQGSVLRVISCSAWARGNGGGALGVEGSFRVPWGMCRGPDRALYVAVHSSDGGEYTDPTPRDTGDILRLELDTDDEWERNPSASTGSQQGRIVRGPAVLSAAEVMPRLLRGQAWQLQERPSELKGNAIAESIRQEFEWCVHLQLSIMNSCIIKCLVA